jgi:hypothetical protein
MSQLNTWSPTEMHDWTFRSAQYDWEEARAVFVFKGYKSTNILVAQGVSDLHIPQMNEWGPSVSVNEATETDVGAGSKKLTIEMQSGDTITVMAKSFSFERS